MFARAVCARCSRTVEAVRFSVQTRGTVVYTVEGRDQHQGVRGVVSQPLCKYYLVIVFAPRSSIGIGPHVTRPDTAHAALARGRRAAFVHNR